MYVEIPENLTEHTVILEFGAEDNLYLGSAGSEISSRLLVNMVWL